MLEVDFLLKFKSRSSTYKKILFVLLISFEALLIIFSSVSFSYISGLSMDSIETMNKKVVEKLSKNTQFMNEIINKFCLLLFNDNQINTLFYGTEIEGDYYDEISIINHLHNMSEAYGMIHSVVIYNNVAERFYSWDTNFHSDPLTQQIIQGNDIKSPLWRVLPDDVYYSNESVLTYVMRDPLNTGGFVLVNVRPSWLEDDIKNESNEDLKLLVVNSDGNIVVQSKNASSDSKLSNQITDKFTEENGSFKYKFENNVPAIVTYHKIDETDWFFISINSYENLFSMILKMKYFSVLITILFGLFGVIMIIPIGKSIYNPIAKLVAWTEKMFEIKNVQNDDLQYLSEILEYSHQFKTLDRQLMFREIFINGESSHLNTQKCFQLSEPLKNTKKIVLAYVKTISTEIGRRILSDFPCEIVTIKRGDGFVIIADADNINELDIRLDKMLELCDRIVISKSEIMDINENLNKRFRELENALSYRLIFGDKCLITQEKILSNTQNADKLIYPTEISINLVNSIKNDGLNESMKLFNEFLDKISENSIDNYLIALTKLIIFLASNEKGEILEHIGSYSQKIISADTKEEILNIFKEVFNKLSRMNENISKNNLMLAPKTKNEVVVDAVKMIVDNTYYNSSLCVSSIANELKMSSGYVGRLFVQVTGISVSEYINQLRINEAVRILSSTDYSIKKVMELVGYDNESTFYKKFKSYIGMTPKEFRFSNSDSDYIV